MISLIEFVSVIKLDRVLKNEKLLFELLKKSHIIKGLNIFSLFSSLLFLLLFSFFFS